MSKVPVTPEVGEFLAKLLKASRAGTIPWEEESDGNAFTARLEGDYRVVIREVPDFDEKDDLPDHVLTVFAGDEEIFEVDRRDVEPSQLAEVLQEPLEYSYHFFRELWDRALLKARRVSEHVAALNKALGAKLK